MHCGAPEGRYRGGVFVKICGITSEDDALLAVAMGADAVGFVFAASKRQVSTKLARDIAVRLPSEVLTVGVFRGQGTQQIVDITHEAGLRAAQLHGHETPAEAHKIRSLVPMTIKAFAAGDPATDDLDDYAADIILIDSPAPGSGEVFDWSIAEGAPDHRPLLLAGGLTPENVGDAIRRVRPWGVDVSTGVESAPGVKDARKVAAFVKAAKAAGDEIESDLGYVPAAAPPFDWLNE
jgi:phosphoribosylanthranilate isomerase